MYSLTGYLLEVHSLDRCVALALEHMYMYIQLAVDSLFDVIIELKHLALALEHRYIQGYEFLQWLVPNG